MIQLGALFSGFSLYALFTWLPIWRLASAAHAEGLFSYFVVIAILVFGVFMTSGGRSGFSFLRFGPAFAAGAMMSIGWSDGTWELVAGGAFLFGAAWLFWGE